MGRKGRYGTGNVQYDWRDGPIPSSNPKKVKGGISLASQRGGIGRTWWSKRWIEVLESFGWTSRLQRGKRYARKGQVTSLKVSVKGVRAEVQGTRSRPYRVELHLEPTGPAAWDRVVKGLREDAGLVASLLAGEVPKQLEAVFRKAKASLLPRRAKEMHTTCSCPDTANPCKHLAAVHYLLAERFDQDPFIIFLLRGKGREDVLEAVTSRAANVKGPGPRSPEEGSGTERPRVRAKARTKEELMAYWRPGPRFMAADSTPCAPAVNLSVMKRIGEPTICSASQRVFLWRALSRTYSLVTEKALAVGRGEGMSPIPKGIIDERRSGKGSSGPGRRRGSGRSGKRRGGPERKTWAGPSGKGSSRQTGKGRTVLPRKRSPRPGRKKRYRSTGKGSSGPARRGGRSSDRSGRTKIKSKARGVSRKRSKK